MLSHGPVSIMRGNQGKAKRQNGSEPFRPPVSVCETAFRLLWRHKSQKKNFNANSMMRSLFSVAVTCPPEVWSIFVPGD